MTESTTLLVADPAIEGILQVLRASPQPLTLAQIQKQYTGPKLAKKRFQEIVEEKLRDKTLFVCSPSGKQSRYWDRDEQQQVIDTLLDTLKAKDQLESEATKAVVAALGKATTPKAVKAAIVALRTENRIFDHPGKGKTPILSLKPYDPLANLTLPAPALKALKSVWEKTAQAGVSLERFLNRVGELLSPARSSSESPVAQPPAVEPPSVPVSMTPAPAAQAVAAPAPPAPVQSAQPRPEEEVREIVLRALDEAGPSVPIAVSELRRQLPAPHHGTVFDRVVWELKASGHLFVVRHNHPGILSDEEREALLKDDEGGYYVDIARPDP